MADVSVRPARVEDAPEVARVQLLTWRSAYSRLLPPLEVTQDEVAEAWREAVAAPPSARHLLLVALEGDALVGLASSGPATDDDLDPELTSELTALLVEPRWGRRGHGSRLVAASVDLWRTAGATTGVTWAFEADTVTTAFLESAGWGFDGLGRGLDTGARLVPQRRLHSSL